VRALLAQQLQWQYGLVGGAALPCLGVALLARFGFGSAPLPRLDIAAFLMVVTGAAISGLLPGFK